MFIRRTFCEKNVNRGKTYTVTTHTHLDEKSNDNLRNSVYDDSIDYNMMKIRRLCNYEQRKFDISGYAYDRKSN